MSWQATLICALMAAVALIAIYLLIDELLRHRRDKRTFRINPMFRVGDDAKHLGRGL